MELVEDRIYSIFEERWGESFEPSFMEMYEGKFPQDFGAMF